MRWIAFLGLMWALGGSAADLYKPAAGPFQVKTVTLEWHDIVRDRDVPAKIYFPEGATGACPLIVFSHGLGGSRDGYEYLGRHWASHGYVSVHVEHHGSDSAVWRGTGDRAESMRRAMLDPANAVNRPLDITFAIDQLTAVNSSNGPLRHKLALDKIGAAGHSFGAWTTLVLAGQRRGANEKSWADNRVKAAIAMSAPVVGRASPSHFAAITIPVLHLTGTEDTIALTGGAATDRRVPFDMTANAPQYLVTFAGADHMVFSGRMAGGRNSAADASVREMVCSTTTAFWDAWLRADATARRWLSDGSFEQAIGKRGVVEQKKPAAH